MAAEQEARIAQLKERIKQATGNKIRFEERLQRLQSEREQLLRQLAELGVKPEQLDDEIKRLQGEIEALLREADALLPSDLLRG